MTRASITITYPKPMGNPNDHGALVYAFIVPKRPEYEETMKRMLEAMQEKLDLTVSESEGIFIASAHLPVSTDMFRPGDMLRFPLEYARAEMLAHCKDEGLVLHTDAIEHNVYAIEKLRTYFDESASALDIELIWDDPDLRRKVFREHPYAAPNSVPLIFETDEFGFADRDEVLDRAHRYKFIPDHRYIPYIDDMVSKAYDLECATDVLSELYSKGARIDAAILDGISLRSNGIRAIQLVATMPNGRDDALYLIKEALLTGLAKDEGFGREVCLHADTSKGIHHADVISIIFRDRNDVRATSHEFRERIRTVITDAVHAIGWTICWHTDAWAEEQPNVNRYAEKQMNIVQPDTKTNGDHYFGDPYWWPYIRVTETKTYHSDHAIVLDIDVDDEEHPRYMMSAVFNDIEQYRAWLTAPYGTWPADEKGE